MQFSYRAKQENQAEAAGVIEAVDLSAAVAHLRRKGLYPLRLIPLEGARSERSPASFGRPLGREALSLWARTVGQGLGAGLSLTQALHLLAQQEQQRPAGQAARFLEQRVTGGMSLGDAMAQSKELFSPLAVSLVRAAEAAGALEQVLIALADRMEAESELIAKVRSALIYPLFVLLVGLLTAGLLVWLVVPKLTLLFAETGQPIPWATRIFILLGKGGIAALAVGGAATLALLFARRRAGAKGGSLSRFSGLLKRLPWAERLLRQAELARCSSSLALLLGQGLSLAESLRLVAGTIGWPELKAQVQRSRELIIEGMPVSAGFRRAGVQDPFLLTLIAMGEAHGDLARAFHQAGVRYQQEVDRTVRVLSTLIEPLMILVVGGVVGAIVFSMLLPIFQINFAAG